LPAKAEHYKKNTHLSWPGEVRCGHGPAHCIAWVRTADHLAWCSLLPPTFIKGTCMYLRDASCMSLPGHPLT